MAADRFILWIALALIAGSLGVSAAHALLIAATPVQSPRPEGGIESTAPPREDPAPALRTVLARPLFENGRRPPREPIPVARVEPPPPPPPRSPVPQVVGIVVTPEVRAGLFATGQGRPVRRLQGESIQDWRIDEVTPLFITLSRGGERQTVSLTRAARPAAKKFSF